MWRAFSLLQHFSGWQCPLEQEDSCYLLDMGGKKDWLVQLFWSLLLSVRDFFGASER